MTSVRRQRLKRALAEARTSLDKVEHSGEVLSPLNSLRGVKSKSPRREGNLLSRTRPRTRPSFDLIADAVLGTEDKYVSRFNSENKDDFSGIVNEGMARLRSNQEESTIENKSERIGLEVDGRPIWSALLDSNRGYDQEVITTHQRRESDELPAWPPILKLSTHNTFQSWNTVPENLQATNAIEKIIDKPATNLNPLLLMGESGVGRSHLLSAAAQAMLYRDHGHVVLIHVSTLLDENILAKGWREIIPQCCLLAFDDLHLAPSAIANELGMMIDFALNMGVQVLATTKSDPSTWEMNRLWEVMKGATITTMKAPSRASLVTHLRRNCSMRSILLSDDAIAAIATFPEGGWREVDATFERVALAIESGADINDAADVRDLLTETLMSYEDKMPLDYMSVEDLAEGIVTSALDEVFTEQDGFGVELHAELPEIGIDDYQPPELGSISSDDLLTRHLNEALLPHVTTTLDLDEADRHLIHTDDTLSSLDQSRVRETVSSIGNIAHTAFEELQDGHELNAVILARLETELSMLFQRSNNAGVDELIEIADRIKGIEEELAKMSPHDVVGIAVDHDPRSALVKSRVLARLRPKRILMPEATA
jgi:chromosomal replication initiation ATPase DnaA